MGTTALTGQTERRAGSLGGTGRRHGGDGGTWDPHPIDVAGVDKGFLVLTDQQLTIGHRKRLRGKPEPWHTFPVENLEILSDHPEGVAFHVTGLGLRTMD